ncbi:MAG: Asp-tRNA(Asn)/Glu-tRNA(Gln) amidotransferase subunit GatC [Planctomycetes bacterium]|nr:Asp-tRNA(Asn)/Glu-tRNA(Gln) amidotransferase subunit GatC [Planctomycetota bacterium]
MGDDFKEIDSIANLSRIKLDDSERGKFKNQLVKILDYVKKLNELDLNSVEPALHTSSLKNVFREDALKPSYQRESVLDISPSNLKGFFKVPKIIE